MPFAACLLERRVTTLFRLPYALYRPEGYPAGRRWPLVLFLHGAGERGTDLQAVERHGLPYELARGLTIPALVAAPQCPDGIWWDRPALAALLDELVEREAVDPARVVVTGISMGGYGTWELATWYPDRFAAIAPVCGGGLPLLAGRLRDVPVWAFHGAQDAVIPPERSEEMVEAVQAAGGTARLTLYPDIGHDAWTRAYAGRELVDWLLGHRREG